MKVIGLTGGIGSGKTTVARIIEKNFDAKIIIADDIGSLLMEKGSKSYQVIIEYFGKSLLDNHMNIDKKKLSKLVFADKRKLEILNSFIHPFVEDYIISEINTLKNIDYQGFVIIESAILIEAGYQSICDEIWYVSSDEQLRRERLKLNRDYSDEKITKIMNNQLNDSEFVKNSKKIIRNNGDIDQIIKQIEVLLVK